MEPSAREKRERIIAHAYAQIALFMPGPPQVPYDELVKGMLQAISAHRGWSIEKLIAYRKKVYFEALINKLEHGNATASDIEEFRRLAEEIMRSPLWTWWPPEKKQRIEAALKKATK